MAKNDPYSSGYANARKLAADVGAEPEHHAYGGRMGRMPMRAPRIANPAAGMLRPAGAMPMPGTLPGAGPGLPPGPMPQGGPMMPAGAMPRPGMKHGGKAKKYAKGGECKTMVHKHEKHDHPGTKLTKLGHGGALAKMRRGQMSPSGEPTSKHGRGVNGIGEHKHGGKIKKMAMGGGVGAMRKGGGDDEGDPVKIGGPPDAKSFTPATRGRGKTAVGESLGKEPKPHDYPSHEKHAKEGVGGYKRGGKVKHKSMGGDIQTGRANADGSPSKPHIPNASEVAVTAKSKGKNGIRGG